MLHTSLTLVMFNPHQTDMSDLGFVDYDQAASMIETMTTILVMKHASSGDVDGKPFVSLVVNLTSEFGNTLNGRAAKIVDK